MRTSERDRIKQLVKETFWEFEDENLETLTPSLFRDWARKNIHEDCLDATAVLYHSRDFWYRVEKLCHLHKQLLCLHSPIK